jgi:hypothetical protein
VAESEKWAAQLTLKLAAQIAGKALRRGGLNDKKRESSTL